ncbi:DUF3180 family protein [Rhodococcus hoagii]|nr:DUF3180 family protein [Prescottella equi]
MASAAGRVRLASPDPVYAGASLYPVALIERFSLSSSAHRVREHAIGDGPRQLHPITAARAVALAKASALVGAASEGVGQGFLVFLWPTEVAPAGGRVRQFGRHRRVDCGVLLVAAALWLEHCCRTPTTTRTSQRIERHTPRINGHNGLLPPLCPELGTLPVRLP